VNEVAVDFKKLGLVVGFLLLFFSATAMSQSVSLSDTVPIADTELTLLSNTDQCLTDCEAWLEWDLRESMSSKSVSTKPNSYFNFEVSKRSAKTQVLRDFGIEVWIKTESTIVDYCWGDVVSSVVEPKDLNFGELRSACETIGCVEGKVKGFCDCVSQERSECGSHIEASFEKVSNSPYGFYFKKGEVYRFRVWGKKNPKLGENDVDWIPTILGERISEWAWWSSSWKTRYQLTWTAPYDLNAGNVVHFGDIDFSAMDIVMDDLNDFRVVYNDVTDLNRWVEGNSASTDGNFWIKLDNGLSAGVQASFYVYTNNAAAGTPNRHISYLVDGFEDGEYTSNLVWIADNVNTEADSEVQSVIKHDGTYALKVDNTTDNQPYLETILTSEINPTEISVFVYCTNTAEGGGVKYKDTSVTEAYPFIKDGTFQTLDTTGWTDTTVVASNDTWYLLKTVFDWTANTANFEFWNSTITTKLAEVKDVNITTFSGIKKIQLGRYGNNTGEQVYFDKSDVNVAYSIGSAEFDVGVAADFSTTFNPASLDAEDGVASLAVDFNDTSVYTGTAISNKNYRWDFNSVTYSFDQNITRTFTTIADYNVCLDANATIDGSDYSSQSCSTVSIKGYPQNVDFNFTPASPSKDETVRFQASSDSSGVEWVWGFGDGNFSTGQDINHSFPSGDWNVCLTAIAPVDLNTRHCENIEIYGVGLVQFYDENTGAKLVPTTLTVDGTSYVSDVNSKGVLNLALAGWSSGDHTIIASLADYGSREWVVDFNEFSYFYKNFAMLEDANGTSIDFKFYDTDGTTILDNATVEVRIEDENYASSKQTNESGEVTFFLNPSDQNYSFRIIREDDTVVWFYVIKVVFKIPKDSDSLALISPFSLDVTRLGNASFAGATEDLNIYILPNTLGYYSFDFNASGYYPRSLQVRLKGNPLTYSLQGYLATTTNSVYTFFYIKESKLLTPLSNVMVKSFRTIAGEGYVEVQSEISDISGTANMVFLVDKEYDLEFYYKGEQVFADSTSSFLTPSTTEYDVYLDIGFGEWVTPSQSYITVEFEPAGGVALHSSPFDLVQTILSTVGLIDSIRFVAENYDVNIFDDLYVAGVEYGKEITHSFNPADLNTSYPLNVTVYTTLEDGTVLIRKASYMMSSSSTSIRGQLQNRLRSLWGCSTTNLDEPCTALALLAVLLGIGVCGSFSFVQTSDYNALGIVAIVILAFFTLLAWIPLYVFGLAAIGAAGAYLMTRERM